MANGASPILNREAAKKELIVLIDRLRDVAVENIDGNGDMSPIVKDRVRELADYVRMIEIALRAENDSAGRPKVAAKR